MDIKHLVLFLTLPLLGFALLILKRKLAQGKKAGGNRPPGPWRLPIIGNLHQVGSMPHRSLLRLSRKHGPLMFLYLGSIPTLVISSSEALKSIFKYHDITFSSRPVLKVAQKFTFNCSNISLAPYGENWRQARKLGVVELLNSKRIRSFHHVREQEVSMLVAAIADRSSSSSNSSINLSEMIFSLSYNIMRQVLFGDVGCPDSYRGERSSFHEVMENVQELVARFCVADYFPGLVWIDRITGLNERVERTFDQMKLFLKMVIDEHLNRVKKKGNDDDDDEFHKEDLVDVLLRMHNEALPHGGFLSDMDYVKGIIEDLFFGGVDTTSTTIIWTMMEIMRHPRVMIKVKQELRDVIISKNKVKESELEHLKYIKLVIKESLRLHPPAPILLPRETLQSCTIEGYDIPARTRVIINASAIASDSNIWKNPNEFWPERFALTGIDLKGHDYEFVPFGVGRRSCPGADFALVIVELVLANLLHCFEWSLPNGMSIQDIDVEEKLGIVMHKKEPLCLVAMAKN